MVCLIKLPGKVGLPGKVALPGNLVHSLAELSGF